MSGKIAISNKILVVALIILGLAVYANTFRNGMFWDDYDFILNNQFVRNFEFGKFFSENIIAGAGFQSNYWRPVLLTVFSLEYHLWQDFAPLYHVVNTLLHIAAGILLFRILQQIFQSRWPGFLTAIVFLIHPVQTEAVTYANSLGDSLSVFFMFAGVLLFLRGRRLWPLLMYALALMSKETAIIMPGLLGLAVFFNSKNQADSFGERLRAVGRAVWPYLAMAGVYILLRATVLNFGSTFNLYNEQNLFTGNMTVRILTFFRILTVYLGLLFWPTGLHMERTVGIATNFFGSPDVLLGGSVAAGLLVLAVWGLKRFPAVSFGVFWFFGSLLPTSNIVVPINGLLYEHWLYVPMIGFFLALVWAGIELGRRFGIQKPLTVLFAIWVIFLGGLAIRRNTDWHDPIRFYNQILTYNQTSYRIYNNLGMAYADAGRREDAETNYKKAIALDSEVAVAYHNLGNSRRDNGDWKQAASYYEQALSRDPRFVFSSTALAQLYLGENKHKEARDVLEKSLSATGDRLDLLVFLYQIAELDRDYEGALGYLERALDLDPRNGYLQESYLEIRKKKAKVGL